MRRSKLAGIIAVALALFWGQAAEAETTVTISGGGFGHGMGMSQYGAYGRALSGKSDRNILGHYYSGALVRRKQMPRQIRVGLLQSKSTIAVSSEATNSSSGQAEFRIAGRSRRLASGGPDVTWNVEPSSTGGMHLFKNGVPVVKHGNGVFGDTDHPLLFTWEYGSLVHVLDKNMNYRYGHLEFGTYSSGSCGVGFCLRLVLSQSMQRYLYGLGEVPASWPFAALQSQAIAGRTYAYEKTQRLGQHRYPCGCAVYDSTVDQAYLGDAQRTRSGIYWKRWKGAVDSTKSQVLLYNRRPIQALYMSSSGGHTENNENVWGGAPVSYLRGVSDLADAVAANPNHSWRVTMGWGEFASRLSSSYNIGTLSGFRLVRPFGVSGRVTVVKPGIGGGARIAGSRGVVRVSGWSLRSSLGLKDTLFRVRIDYAVAAPFASTYRSARGALGGPAGPRETSATLPHGGVRQLFAHGAVYQRPGTSTAFSLWGPVEARYRRMGEASSSCGYPTSDLQPDGDGLTATFQRGEIRLTANGSVSVDCGH